MEGSLPYFLNNTSIKHYGDSPKMRIYLARALRAKLGVRRSLFVRRVYIKERGSAPKAIHITRRDWFHNAGSKIREQ